MADVIANVDAYVVINEVANVAANKKILLILKMILFPICKSKPRKNIFFLFVVGCLFFTACKKDSLITSADALLTSSADTLKFDTVFTSIGSITQSFKIRNPNNQRLLLSSVKLMGGALSPYRININGLAATEAVNIEVAAEDSLYLFVSVSINPNAANLPFIVKDSIGISYNGNTKWVQLEAYGQNANFLRNTVINQNRRWNNLLPYVILGTVRIDTSVTLTIDPGCKIYAASNAPILVDGTLIVNGSKAMPVLFTGNRLDADYKDLPASWPGIYCRESSKNNVFTYAIVKNAYQAIVAESPALNTNPKITLHQCIIDNAYDAGLLCVASSVKADNSLIVNCGSNFSVALGGSYQLVNCTIAAYSTFISHKKPVLSVNNFLLINGAAITNSLSAQFTNCIFWGEEGQVADEVVVSKQGLDAFDVSFKNCLYKAIADPAYSTITGAIKNQSPMFDSIDVNKKIFDFHINNPAAPGINKGLLVSFLKDLDGNNRRVGMPDIGCYEQQ